VSDHTPGDRGARSFTELVATRRMVRAFRPEPVDRGLLAGLVDTASRAPSAGKTQGWSLVVLEGTATTEFWSATMPGDVRATFRWRHLFDAPVVALSFADPHAYLERYSESDKSRTRLGESLEAWPVDYWTVDASFATMTLLLAAHDAGLGALFFGVFGGEDELRSRLRVPPHLVLIGAVALGYERTPQPHEAGDAAFGRGRSASRPRAGAESILHFGGW
jgi:nitroreductase